MAGIAGIARPAAGALVQRMLDTMAHRGPVGSQVVEVDGVTLGLAWPQAQSDLPQFLESDQAVRDQAQSEHLAEGRVTEEGLILRRDLLGVAPLYYGRDADAALCFASEVKALLQATDDVHELGPGYVHDGTRAVPYKHLTKQDPQDEPLEQMAEELHRRLAAAVEQRLNKGEVGSWLSGGLDSSGMAALARPHLKELHTFAVGLPGAPDLEFARVVAKSIQADHHEIVVSQEELVEALPETIYHLE
jgi:asparagine synthase (glutamine-hydrolysing)